MQNTILQTAKYCFSGFNQFLICETKAQAKTYLKQNSSINRIKDLVTITEELRAKILKDYVECIHVVYDITSGYAIPLENDTRSDDEIREQLWNDDDSAEVADEKHYADMAKFFDENVIDMRFNSYLPFCSRCGKAEPDYVGMMKFSNQALMPITFAFCVACRDALVQLQIQRTQSPERFGV